MILAYLPAAGLMLAKDSANAHDFGRLPPAERPKLLQQEQILIDYAGDSGK